MIRHFRADVSFTLGNGFHGYFKFILRCAVEQESSGAATQHLAHVFIGCMEGKNDQPYRWKFFCDTRNKIQSARLGGGKLQQYQLRLVLRNKTQSFCSITGLGDNFHLRNVCKECPNSTTNQRMLNGYQNSKMLHL